MIRDALFGGEGLPALRKGMDVSRMRHRVTAENVANVLTTDYRAKRVAFEEYLQQAGGSLSAARTQPGHIAAGPSGIGSVTPRVRPTDDPLLPNGINNVDVEREMAELSWNRTMYSALTQFTSRRYRSLTEAMRIGNG